jgi:acetyltransferase-like isoleucine patch superfamily enzyme
VGDFVFIYNKVHLCQGAKIGNFVWIFPYCIFTNDPHPPSLGDCGPTVGDYAVLGTRITVLPGRQIGRDAFVGSHTLVNRDVPDLTIAAGNPMSLKGSVDRIKLMGTMKPAYPWRRHYHSRPDHVRFPADIVQRWREEFPE